MIPLLSPYYPWADLTARAGEREDRRLQPAGGTRDTAAFPEHREREYFRAICTGDGFSVRAAGIASFKTETHKVYPKALWPAHLFRSAAARSQARSGISGSLLPYWRGSRLFQFVPALKASGSLLRLLRSVAVDLRQKSSRCCSQAFHVSTLSAGRSGLAASVGRTPIDQKENRKCPTIERRNPT